MGTLARGRRRPSLTGLIALGIVVLAGGAAAGPTRAATPIDGAASGKEKIHALVSFERRPGAAALERLAAAGAKVRFRYHLVPAVAIEVPEQALERIRGQAGVRRVERDVTITAFDHGANTGDLEYENAWGVEHIGAREAHLAGVTGSGVKVGVIDTGIDYVHDDPDDSPYVVDPEFGANYAGGVDIYNGDDDPFDDNGHGTHVSGILAAEKNGYLVVGVAPDVDLYAIKILNANGEGEYSHLIAALEWAVDHDLDVVNMSLGAHEPSATLAEAVANAHAAGLTMVAASGNVNPLDFWELLYGCPVAYPAAYPQVLSTTFTNGNDALTGYSCTGPEVDLAAPGDQVFSTVPTGTCMFCTPYGYSAQSGTSMASPHLAGLVALLLDAGLADAGSAGFLDDAKDVLCATADVGFGVNSTPIPPSDPRYPNYFGCGVIDAAEAVLSLAPPANAAPVAVDDVATTKPDTSVTVDVLANDTDADGDTLSVANVADPANGTAAANPDGTVTYVPDAGFTGIDTFTYEATDGEASDAATVTVTVEAAPVNGPPVATDDTATTIEDTPVTVAVLANDTDADGDPLALVSVGAATGGTATPNPDGTITFSPTADTSGTGSFTYVVSDGADTDEGTVTITVTPVDDPPTADATSASTTAPASVAVGLSGDDVDTCELAFQVVDLPDHGGVGGLTNAACAPSGAGGTDSASVTYTPAAGFSGTDTFTYRVGDGTSWSLPATATISVAAAPPPPPATHHVGDLDAVAVVSGRTWTARVTVRVDLADHAPGSGATVAGTWSGAATGTASCTTAGTGTCIVERPGLPKKSTITFTVTGVTLSGSTYQSSANHDPDGSSNGTAVTIRK